MKSLIRVKLLIAVLTGNLLSCYLPSLNAQAFQRTVRVEGRQTAVVSTSMVRLSDIAEVSSALITDDETVIALKKIEITKSPTPGEETTLPAAKILERLREEKVNLDEITYVLPRIITIKRASRALTAEELQAAIVEFFADSGRDVVVKSVDYQGDKQVLPGTTEIELKPFNTIKPQEIGFTVYAKSGEEVTQRFNTKALIDEWLEIPVAKRSLGRGSQIGPDDFTMARLNLGSLPSDVAREYDEVVGLSASSEIAPGEIFRKNKLTIPPVIEQGSKVTLLYKKGALEARATGTALENGGNGEEIKVRNENSRRIVSGKVLEAGLVGVN